jgi:uncharacterized membrane protein YraQ (UPF0718 family)
MKLKNKLRQISGSWRFLAVVVLIYGGFLLFDTATSLKMVNCSAGILADIIPIFLTVSVLVFLSDYFISPRFIIKYLRQNSLLKWLLVIIGGILSTGPIYMWYPLLAELRSKVLDDGMVACFLYNRAIKIPLLPITILYFGWRYVVVLGAVMVGASVFQGFIINQIMGGKNENCCGR